VRESAGALAIRSPSELFRRMLALTEVDKLVEISLPDATLVAPRSERRRAAAKGPEARSLLELAVASTQSRERTVDIALGLVVALATATISSAQSASVTLNRRGRLVTVASSDDVAVRLDGDQYATGQGPCVFAATHGRQAHVESAAEESRWPQFIPHAVDAGITSILSTPLTVGLVPAGALNLYSRGDDGFGTEHVELVDLIARQAAEVLAPDGDDLGAVERVVRLQDALHAREMIAHAQGILMERERVSAETATANMHRTSRDAGVTLRRLATDVVAAAGTPTGPSSHE
jgi:hypothetical protein